MDETCTYIGNAFDIGPECRSSATKEADVLRAEVVFDYVDCTTSDFAYLVSSWWTRTHVEVVCGRDELTWGTLTDSDEWLQCESLIEGRVKSPRALVFVVWSPQTLTMTKPSFFLCSPEHGPISRSPLPRPPTVSPEATFPSRISNLSPRLPSIDSIMSSVGTYEVPAVIISVYSISFSPTAHIHPSHTTHLVVSTCPMGSHAHEWSLGTTSGTRTHGRHFIDAYVPRYGRVCHIRGLNFFGTYVLL